MSNQCILFDWWWSQNGPRKEGTLSVGEIATGLARAKQDGVVRGKNGGQLTATGWDFAVLKFLIKYCTTSPEVHQKLKAYADPRTGNYAGYKKLIDQRAEIRQPSTTVCTTRSSPQTQIHEPSVASLDEKLADVNAKVSLPSVIAGLQSAVKSGGIDYEMLKKAVTDLSSLGYYFDDALFPNLENTENYTDSIGKSPSNLAEALLWKLGKWKSYKKFTDYYINDILKPGQNYVIFYAFARHLKDRSNPIFDQHVIRALWAICGDLTNLEKDNCKAFLFHRDGKWKQVGSGTTSIECYTIYCRRIMSLTTGTPRSSLREIDRLLMPLGQAIKNTTKTYDEFQRLCGR